MEAKTSKEKKAKELEMGYMLKLVKEVLRQIVRNSH